MSVGTFIQKENFTLARTQPQELISKGWVRCTWLVRERRSSRSRCRTVYSFCHLVTFTRELMEVGLPLDKLVKYTDNMGAQYIHLVQTTFLVILGCVVVRTEGENCNSFTSVSCLQSLWLLFLIPFILLM